MKRIILSMAMAMCMASTAFAATSSQTLQAAGINKLTPEQQAAVVQHIATLNAQNAQTPSASEDSVVATVDKYADISIKIGKALASGAKEVGATANEFLATPAGKWTLAIIVYKTMGSDIMMFTSAIFVLIVGLTTIRYLAKRMRSATITYNTEVKNWFGNHPKSKEVVPPFTDTDIWFITIWTFITLAIATVLMVNIG